MDDKHLLEQLELYGANVVSQTVSGFKCRCRFSHTFTYEKLDDWCCVCQTSEFQDSLISEVNSELEELETYLQVFKVNHHGIVTVICHTGHVIDYDIDDIPNNCTKCSSRDISSIGYENIIWHDVEGCNHNSSNDTSEDDIDGLDYLDVDLIGPIDDAELQYETDGAELQYETDGAELQYETDEIDSTISQSDNFDIYNSLVGDECKSVNPFNTVIRNNVRDQLDWLTISNDAEPSLVNNFTNILDDLSDQEKVIYMKKVRISEFRPNNIEVTVDEMFDPHKIKSCIISNDQLHTDEDQCM